MSRKPTIYHHCHFLSTYTILSFVHFHYDRLVFKCFNGLPLRNYSVKLQWCSRSTRAASSGQHFGTCYLIIWNRLQAWTFFRELQVLANSVLLFRFRVSLDSFFLFNFVLKNCNFRVLKISFRYKEYDALDFLFSFIYV